MNKPLRISVLGCGWLGLPLAVELVKAGYPVKGSTTDKKKLDVLKNDHVIPYHIVLDPLFSMGEPEFFECDVCVYNIPPPRIRLAEKYFIKQTSEVLRILDEVNNTPVKLLFVSSTSVYPSNNGIVKEKDAVNPEKSSGRTLLRAEYILKESAHGETTVVRFGGLVGHDRNPAKFLAGRKGLKGGDNPVNLIHRDDCIGIIMRIIEQEKWGYTFNACMPEHPLRKEFYTRAAEKLNLPVPEFNPLHDDGYKIVDSTFLMKELNYSFKYTDPFKVL